VRTASAINPYSHVVDAVRGAGTADAVVIAGALAAAVAFIALTQLGAERAFARLVHAD